MEGEGHQPLKVPIKRFDKSLPLPERKTQGAAGYDLVAREETIIPAQTVGYVPLNIAMELPPGCWAMVAARGSTHKLGLMPVHGIGIGDEDFCGDGDEYKFPVFNFTNKETTVSRGARIGQLLIFRYTTLQFHEMDSLESPDRGGFGTTGTH